MPGPVPEPTNAAKASVRVRRQRALLLNKLLDTPGLLTAVTQRSEIPTISTETGEIEFSGERLLRVRAQLTALDAAIAEETGRKHSDGQRLNWLVQAQSRLDEQEARLSARGQPAGKEQRKTRSELRETSREQVDLG